MNELRKLRSIKVKDIRPPKVPKAIREQAKAVRSKWRKIVTGNEKKRVRDFIRETQDQPKYVKFFDKVAFTIGVLNIGVCQYFVLNRPDVFPLWYAVVMPILLVSRYAYFKHLGLQYFLIDFCYFVVCCSLANILIFKSSALLFKVLFIHGCGPLTLAIPVWRNSFVFHDFDKIVSVYIHILPCLLYYTLRWHGSSLWGAAVSGVCIATQCEPITIIDYAAAVAMYMVWQAFYLLKTEYLDKKKLDNNPKLLTSLRWMSSDTKNPLARSILKMLRKIGVFARDEDYDSTTIKTKAVFVASQLLYTVVAFLPTPLMYYSSACHLLYISLIVVNSVFNGASFYIEVFSKRYNLHITKIEEMQQIAKAADIVAEEIATTLQQQENSNGTAVPTTRATTTTTTAAASATPDNDIANHATPASNGKLPAKLATGGVLDSFPQHMSREELTELAESMQKTSEDAWRCIVEHAEEAEELQRTYSGNFDELYEDFLEKDDNYDCDDNNDDDGEGVDDGEGDVIDADFDIDGIQNVMGRKSSSSSSSTSREGNPSLSDEVSVDNHSSSSNNNNNNNNNAVVSSMECVDSAKTPSNNNESQDAEYCTETKSSSSRLKGDGNRTVADVDSGYDSAGSDANLLEKLENDSELRNRCNRALSIDR